MSAEGTVRRGDYRNYYKGHMDKIKGEGGSGGGMGVSSTLNALKNSPVKPSDPRLL